MKCLRKYSYFFTLLALSLISFPTYSCTSILNENLAVNRGNVRNQDGLGWCYSYVAADLLSYKTGNRVSALGLVRPGVYFDIVIPKERIAGHTAEKTLNYISNQDYLCLESEISSTDYELSKANKISNNLFLHDVLSDIQKIYFEGREVLAKNNEAKEQGKPLQCLSGKSMNRLKEIFPSVTCATALDIISKYTKHGFLDQLINKSCKKQKMPSFEVQSHYETEYLVFKKNLVNEVNSALVSKNIIGIGYNFAKIANMKGEANHASIIVGRKLNPKTKQCEYLVRNSHGKNCSARNPETRCDTSCASDFSKNCNRENGYFWISERLLSQVMYSVTVVK